MSSTFVYTIGDLEEVLATPTGFPFIQVFYNATGSKRGATGMTMVLVLSAIANAMTNMATASRQLWAFARDGGVPLHAWFAKVKFEIPLNGECGCFCMNAADQFSYSFYCRFHHTVLAGQHRIYNSFQSNSVAWNCCLALFVLYLNTLCDNEEVERARIAAEYV